MQFKLLVHTLSTSFNKLRNNPTSEKTGIQKEQSQPSEFCRISWKNLLYSNKHSIQLAKNARKKYNGAKLVQKFVKQFKTFKLA